MTRCSRLNFQFYSNFVLFGKIIIAIITYLNSYFSFKKKNEEGTSAMTKTLENVVVPMFCNASIIGTEEQLTKLKRILEIWSKFIDKAILVKLTKPSTSWSDYQASIVLKFGKVITPVVISTRDIYETYLQQHRDFVNYANNEIHTIEQRSRVILQKIKEGHS